MSAVCVYLSLGSNLDDRNSNILRAIAYLDEELGVTCEARSSIIESKAWGFNGQDFLNCVLRYRLDIDPLRLLAICKKIETQMGRSDSPEFDADGKRIYHNRIIDIDILLFGDMSVDRPELKIPHPLMNKREFILSPLREILLQND